MIVWIICVILAQPVWMAFPAIIAFVPRIELAICVNTQIHALVPIIHVPMVNVLPMPKMAIIHVNARMDGR